MNYSFHLGTKRLTETERLQLMRHIEETDDLDPYLSNLVQKANGALAQEEAPKVDPVSRGTGFDNSVDDGRIHAQLAVAGF